MPDPIEAEPQAWQCASSPERGHTTPQRVLPRREEDKVHTSLTVAPAVGWGQTAGLIVDLPTNTSYSRQHRGSTLQLGATPGTTHNDETEELSSKETPGSSDR